MSVQKRQTTASRQRFALSWVHFFRLVMSAGIVLALITSVILNLASWRMPLPVFLQGLLVGILIASAVGAALSLFVALYFRTSIDEEGISGFDFWGFARKTSWREITAAQPLPLPGLPFLRVFTTRSRFALWLPLFLADPKGFWAAVDHHAPLGSPVRQYMNRYVGR